MLLQFTAGGHELVPLRAGKLVACPGKPRFHHVCDGKVDIVAAEQDILIASASFAERWSTSTRAVDSSGSPRPERLRNMLPSCRPVPCRVIADAFPHKFVVLPRSRRRLSGSATKGASPAGGGFVIWSVVEGGAAAPSRRSTGRVGDSLGRWPVRVSKSFR